MNKEHIKVFDGDIPEDCLNPILASKSVAWDIETSGLECKSARIATCQVCVGGKSVFVIRINEEPPQRLKSLLADSSLRKVFHHAVFDLRFMSYHWLVHPRNIACTKIAGKLAHPQSRDLHSLRGLLKHYFDVDISKKERTSDWSAPNLTDDQLLYAANDVIYLEQLLLRLEKELESSRLLDIAMACFAHIPTRVKLDLLDYADVYTY